jgi:hypothetical protein
MILAVLLLRLCDCDKAIVRAIASDLSALRNAFEAQGPGNDVARGVDQKQVGLLAVDSNHSAAVSRYRNAGKWPRGLHLVQKLTTAEINHRYGGVFFILCVQPPALRRNDQAVAISGFRLDGVHHLARGPVDNSYDSTILAGYIDQIVGPESQRMWRREWPEIDIAHMGALDQIDDAQEMSRIRIAAMDPITELHKLQSAHRSVPRKVLSGLRSYCPAATIDVEVVVDQAR